MIEAKALYKTFGKIVAVKHVDLQVHRGEIFGLLGPNGAGKTTTLRMLYGLLSPTSGEVMLDGISVGKKPLQAQQKIGALPDAGTLYTRLTAKENIQYFGRLHGLKQATIEKNTHELVERLNMYDILNRKTAGFSQGQRMKVSLARALIHDPDYVFLDEPTNGLDVLTTRAVRALLLDLKARNKCVIFSSHLMHEVNNLCDRIGIVAEGELKISGTINETISASGKNNLEDAFIHFAYPQESILHDAISETSINNHENMTIKS